MVESLKLSTSRKILTLDRLHNLGVSKNPDEIEAVNNMPLSTLEVLSGHSTTVEPIGSAREEDVSVNSDPFIQTRSG